MSNADVGQGSQIELVGLGVFDVVSIEVPAESLTMHDVTKLSSTVRQQEPGRVLSIETLKCRGFVGQMTKPERGWQGTAVVTLPTPAGMTTPTIITYTGTVSRVGGFTLEADQTMSFDFDFVPNSVLETEAT